MNGAADSISLRTALSCRCPRCGTGTLYKPGFLSMAVKEKCSDCGLDLAKNDSADGPAVFMIFILGFSLVPLAWLFELAFAPPLWVHAVLWSVVALAATLFALRPLKAYVIALQYKHRPHIWDDQS